ncbi:MAG: hypothetical protein ACON4O_08950 [Lentimonas sp.]
MKTKNTPKSGFALVIALSLMAFILLLLVSITTLVQVESTNAGDSKKQLVARQNAQLGAMIALGNLQKLAGTDQRVTAPAKSLVAPGSDSQLGTSNWTGVWSTKLDDSGNPLNGALDNQVKLDNHRAQWLVSGRLEDFQAILDPSSNGIIGTPTTANSTVKLATKDRSVMEEGDEVVVFTEDIIGDSEASIGEFAYWVSDEGVKARVNLKDPYLEDPSLDAASDYYRQAAALQGDPSVARDNSDNQPFLSGDSLWKGDVNELAPNIITPSSLSLIGVNGNPEEVRRGFFHDFSTTSRSVFSNTKDGGLKKDLSTALLDPAANGLDGQMFGPAGAIATKYDPGGPEWSQLADFYQQSIDNVGVEKGRDIDNPGEVAFKPFSNEEISYQPVITRFHFHFHAIGQNYRFLEYHPENIDASGNVKPGNVWKNPRLLGNYHFIVGYFPMITLWNPYDKDMVFDRNLGMEMSMKGVWLTARYDGYGRPPGSVPRVAQIISNGAMPRFSEQTSYGALYMTLKTEGLVIPAGRSINFSPPNHSTINFQNGEDNVLVPGAGDTFVTGFYSDHRDPQTSVRVGDINERGRPIDPAERAALVPGERHPDSLWMTEHTGAPNFYPRYDDVITGVRTDSNVTNYHVRLYSESFTSSPDPDKCFLSYSTGGTFFSHRDNVKTPRAIRLWAVTGGRTKNNTYGGDNRGAQFSQFIGPMGHSKSYPYGVGRGMRQGLSRFDLEVVEAQEKTINGVARFMNFPDADITGGSERAQLLSQMNPRAPLSHDPAHKLLEKNLGSSNYYQDMMTIEGLTSWAPGYSVGNLFRNYTVGMDGDNLEFGYVGMDVDSIRGSERMILFEVPSRPALGIGQFMHANLMNVGHFSQRLENDNWSWNLQQAAYTPAYAIGNSIGSIFMPLDRTKSLISKNTGYFGRLQNNNFYVNKANSNPGSHYDYSYELNDALWDSYFLSTMIPDSSAQKPSFPTDGVLPNSRIKASSNAIFTTSAKGDEIRSEVVESEKAAAHLMLDGGFNVNSTSVAAWETILGALRDVETLGSDPWNNSDQFKHSFARTTSPLFESTEEIPDPSSSSLQKQDVIVSGFRSLTDQQISDLAAEVVEEIRARSSASGHPFLSLSQFINRSISTADIGDVAQRTDNDGRRRFSYMGALQFAIEQAGINGPPAISKSWTREDGKSEGLFVDEFITPKLPPSIGPFKRSSLEIINSRSFLDAFPGALTQADVLSKIGSVLRPRSDTFTIRSFGSSLDPLTGKDSGEAYLEMTVQRMPEYVDATDEAYESPSTSENINFGRKFAIVSMRWLSPEEI